MGGGGEKWKTSEWGISLEKLNKPPTGVILRYSVIKGSNDSCLKILSTPLPLTVRVPPGICQMAVTLLPSSQIQVQEESLNTSSG